MKIEKAWTVKFKDVPVGKCFEYYGKLYIRSFYADDNTKYATSLSCGDIIHPNPEDDVTIYDNAKVVLI